MNSVTSSSTRAPVGTLGMAHTVTVLAAAAALLVATAVPLAYFQFGKEFSRKELQARVVLQASLINQMISRNPSLWQLNTDTIDELLDRLPTDGTPTIHRVFDASGRLLVECKHSIVARDGRPPFPAITVSEPLYDSGLVVGRVEDVLSLHPLRQATMRVAAIAIFLAIAVFAVLRTIPLRALRRALERAAYLASHDPLTNLPNRALFRDRLEQALATARRHQEKVAVLCVDLDHFKDVNDTFGHAAGDRLLVEATRRLHACLRESDTLARLGGDEFAVVIPGIRQIDSTAAVARRMIEALVAPFTLDDRDAKIGASIGIAFSGEHGHEEPDGLLRCADLALYQAKGEGRGVFRFFEQEMNLRLQARKALEQDLRRALAEGQLAVHYQPQLDLKDGRIKGVEALVRWQHPHRGWIAPMEFIPLAEDLGLIGELTEWVLRTACLQVVQWPELQVAVNMSAALFRQPGLDQTVARALTDSGLQAERLELEITETILLQETETTLSTLSAIKTLGVRVAMDDFGTGYSSLSYLRRFPFDKIKIDGSFVRDVENSADANAIVRAVVRLGRSLGMRTTAEGVETARQADFLISEGCDEVQGFFFGRPMCAADLAKLLSRPPLLAAALPIRSTATPDARAA